MKTKIVYSLTSSDSDIYMEQLLVSVFSLKHFTPGAQVTIVADRETCTRVEYWNLLRDYIEELVPVELADTVSNKERSRWIKTNLRNLIQGDFLFLDTDTVITADLSDADNIDAEIAMVPDLHCKSISSHPFQSSIRKRIKDLFGHVLSPDATYFNSGVILCRDTERTRSFFNEWHALWQEGKDKQSGVLDQRSLAIVCERTGLVKKLSGDYNCQVMGSIEYLHTAKIVHFFNAKWTESPKTISPFFDKTFYAQLKGTDCVPAKVQDMVFHCKSSFCSPSMVVGKEDMILWRTPLFSFIRKIHKKHKLLFRMMNTSARALLFMDRKITRGGQKEQID